MPLKDRLSEVILLLNGRVAWGFGDESEVVRRATQVSSQEVSIPRVVKLRQSGRVGRRGLQGGRGIHEGRIEVGWLGHLGVVKLGGRRRRNVERVVCLPR